MARKSTDLLNIYLDWTARDPDGVINPKVKSQQDWEDAVVAVLSGLCTGAAPASSKLVIVALTATGKEVVIVPFTLKSFNTAIAGAPSKTNAGAVADDKPAATVKGKLSDELPDASIQQIAATPAGPQRDKLVDSYRGTAAGSNSHLYFTPQDWTPSSAAAGFDAVDETLLHELIHSLRQAKGQEEPDRLYAPFAVLRGGEKDANGTPTPQTQYSQVYDTLEEFAAIVITNIYRSQSGRQGLRRAHLLASNGTDPPLPPQLCNPRSFLAVWRPQLERMQRELPALCDQLAQIECPFNPIFELFNAQNRFAPGGRNVLATAWFDPR
jgi:hypothetical protein